ncbi:MAG: D-2-hydroxyacid dehydrogenase [Mailhella sp.]|nr:D-2-hydroxyacid dehydrogenase [Mailhella sp.]
MKKILVTLPVNAEHKQVLAEALGGDASHELVYTEGRAPTPEELADASAVIGIFGRELLPHAGKLEWLQLSWAGSDAFTAPGVLRKDILLTCAVGAYGLAVSEHMLAQTFALIRRFGQYLRNQVRHEWKVMGQVTSVEGSVIAVLGLGDIGGDYARKVKALGAHVIGLRKNNREKPPFLDEQYLISELDAVLPRADIVAMVLPGSPETDGIMDGRRLRLMKPGAFLINAGRGTAIDLEALKAVLREGRLAGAALDVTSPEPLPADDALWDFDNVIITPHIAGQLLLPETLNRIIRIAAENLSRWLRGEALRNVVPH